MRNTMNAVVVALMLLPAIPVALGQEKGVLIEGILDCGMWVTARKSTSASTLEHYVLGLVNGMSLGRSVDFWGASNLKLSREQVYLWMDNYCAKNPLKDVFSGANDLMNERTNGAYSRAVR